MIIKSMSRNSRSFFQLLDYLDKEDSSMSFIWNMYANKRNKQELADEFMKNAGFIKNSRGKIYLYHEVISLEKSNLSRKDIEKILLDLADKYINARAKNHLVYANIHLDTNNPHIHLIISANEIEKSKRVRLSKEEFSRVQSHMEIYKNERYKNLEQSRVYNRGKKSRNDREFEQEQKPKKKKSFTRDYVRENLQKIFSESVTKTALNNALKNRGFEIYTRGNTTGVRYEKKNYRFKTLGVEDDYKKSLINIQQRDERREKWTEFKNSKNKNSTNSFSR